MDDVFAWPDQAQLARVAVRLLAASFLGSLIGLERQLKGKEAGLRTHMLVALGAAVFVMVPREMGYAAADISRVIQGITAGIGFLGAGAILKMPADRHIVGLTTAASIWLTAALGAAVGVGPIWLPTLVAVLALVILWALRQLERVSGVETGRLP
jgi:putative Mg2+ transporter-C (MgtC) family protein